MRFFSKFYILLFLFFPFFINAEELRDVLRDAYNYYPDVKKSKKVFLEKYKDRIIRDLNEQPQISTLLKAKSIKSDKGILYQPRTSPPETIVICHFGDMFSDYEKIGDLYSNLIIE